MRKKNYPSCLDGSSGPTSDFDKAGAVILGVSPDSIDSHGEFINKHGLNFSLLSDDGAKIATKYGVWKEKSMYGM